MNRQRRPEEDFSAVCAEGDTCCEEFDDFAHVDVPLLACTSRTRTGRNVGSSEHRTDMSIIKKILHLRTPARESVRKSSLTSSPDSYSQMNPKDDKNKKLVITNSTEEVNRSPEPWASPPFFDKDEVMVSKYRSSTIYHNLPARCSTASQLAKSKKFGIRGPEPWGAPPLLDKAEVMVNKSGSSTSYREHLRARGSKVLQCTSAQMQKETSKLQLAELQLLDDSIPSATVNFPPPVLTATHHGTQTQAKARASPVQQQVVHGSNNQCSLRSDCVPVCFSGRTTSFVSDAFQQPLNPGTVPISDPQSLMVSNGIVARTKNDLMAIVLPDFLNLGSAEIAARLRSAAPDMYED